MSIVQLMMPGPVGLAAVGGSGHAVRSCQFAAAAALKGEASPSALELPPTCRAFGHGASELLPENYVPGSNASILGFLATQYAIQVIEKMLVRYVTLPQTPPR